MRRPAAATLGWLLLASRIWGPCWLGGRHQQPRPCGQLRSRVSPLRASADSNSLHRDFLEAAKKDGADAALLFASESMPKEFCRNFEQLKKAAKFVAKNVKKAAPQTESGKVLQSSLDKEEGAPREATKEADGAAHSPSSATLRVCNKCLRRLAKKGSDFDDLGKGTGSRRGPPFDLPGTLQQLAGDKNLVVEPSSCLKYCKLGPNVQAVVEPSGLTPAMPGMTEQEMENRCFHHLNDRAACAAAVEVVRQHLDGQKELPLQAVGTQDPPPPEQDGGSGLQRARVRANIRGRLDKILEGIYEEDL